MSQIEEILFRKELEQLFKPIKYEKYRASKQRQAHNKRYGWFGHFENSVCGGDISKVKEYINYPLIDILFLMDKSARENHIAVEEYRKQELRLEHERRKKNS